MSKSMRLKPSKLKTMPTSLAWVFKTEGADGVKALFEGRITGCEDVQGWPDQRRASGSPSWQTC